MDEWISLSARAARSVQTTVGWIFWDPSAVAAYERRGLAAGLGYIVARAAPMAAAGPSAIAAAFGSISPLGIALALNIAATPDDVRAVWEDRNHAVEMGIRRYTPELEPALERIAGDWGPTLRELPLAGRSFSASHLDYVDPDTSLMGGWHAVNFIREWRGDIHWNIVASHGLTGQEASILHNAWLGYDKDWLSQSRGNTPHDIEMAWASLERRGLAENGVVSESGLTLRDDIERATDEIASEVWRCLGHDETQWFIETFEPACEVLLDRVDVTAGPNFQPASRRRRWYGQSAT